MLQFVRKNKCKILKNVSINVYLFMALSVYTFIFNGISAFNTFLKYLLLQVECRTDIFHILKISKNYNDIFYAYDNSLKLIITSHIHDFKQEKIISFC